MKLRMNPKTGRLAERVPDADPEDGPAWYSWDWHEGAVIESYLDDDDVADWQPVVLAPRPPPDQLFALACPACDAHAPLADPAVRDRLFGECDFHGAARYAVTVRHPDHLPDQMLPVFAAGSAVTFHGATTGGVIGPVWGTVTEAAEMSDEDGAAVTGYVVDVDGRSLFVPATAMAKA